MTKSSFLCGAGTLLLTVGGPSARAEILNFDVAKARLLSSPKEQRYGPNSYSRPRVQIWNERQGAILPRNVSVDIGHPGTFAAVVELGFDHINAGTRVDSHYLYFNPPQGELIETTVTFTGRILGVIMDSDRRDGDRLLFSDRLALSEVPRENMPRGHFLARGLELPPVRNISLPHRGYDWVRVEGNAITIHCGASNPGDQIRVITQSSR